MTLKSVMTSVSADESSLKLDHEILESVTSEVRSAIAAVEAEPSRGLKGLFPAMWCEYASIVLAELLQSRRLGAWTFVEAGHNDGPNGHAWLELRDQQGARLWTIDATIDQFSWGGDGPFVSEEQTPAARIYNRLRFEGNWEEWQVLERNPSYRTYLDAFTDQSGLL